MLQFQRFVKDEQLYLKKKYESKYKNHYILRIKIEHFLRTKFVEGLIFFKF